ncbi:hypothetical protein [Allofournierella sp.]
MGRVIGYIPPAKTAELPKGEPAGESKETPAAEKVKKGDGKAVKAAPAGQ